MLNKKFVDFTTTAEGPATQDPLECFEIFENNDDNLFAFLIFMIEVFIAVGTLKNHEFVGNDGVSAEVLKMSLLVIVSIFKRTSKSIFATRIFLEVSTRWKVYPSCK